MPVRDPVFPNCPACDHDVLAGVELCETIVHTDGQGGVHRFEAGDGSHGWDMLWCEECGKMLIVDGEWVIDPANGETRTVDDPDHHTFDRFEENA